MAIWEKEGGAYIARLAGKGRFVLGVARGPGGYYAEVFGRELPDCYPDMDGAKRAAEEGARTLLSEAMDALDASPEADLENESPTP